MLSFMRSVFACDDSENPGAAVHVPQPSPRRAVTLARSRQRPIIQSLCWHVPANIRMHVIQSVRSTAARDNTVPAPEQAKGRFQ